MKRKIKNIIIPQIVYLMQYTTSATVASKVENEEQLAELKKSGKSIIFAFWHGQLWFPAYYFKNRGYVGLASQSRDGGYISSVLNKLGWEMVRGSTSSGGARSLLKLIKKLKKGNDIAITPDGPRGPKHHAQPGIIYLAQKTNSVIIPGGLAFSKRKAFNSWDEFEIPFPFSKVALFFGNPIEVDEDISKDDVNYYKNKVETELNSAVLSAKKILGEKE